MNIDAIRQQLADALNTSGLSQEVFARKHGMSYSSLNKFLCQKATNPRLSSLIQIQEIITAESRGARRLKGRAVSSRASL